MYWSERDFISKVSFIIIQEKWLLDDKIIISFRLWKQWAHNRLKNIIKDTQNFTLPFLTVELTDLRNLYITVWSKLKGFSDEILNFTWKGLQFNWCHCLRRPWFVPSVVPKSTVLRSFFGSSIHWVIIVSNVGMFFQCELIILFTYSISNIDRSEGLNKTPGIWLDLLTVQFSFVTGKFLVHFS